jgi:pyruvate kinase
MRGSAASARGCVRLKVFHARAKGARLRPEKGVNFPNTELHLPALTRDDLRALDFVVEHADLVGFSFVQRPADVALLERELTRRSRGRPLHCSEDRDRACGGESAAADRSMCGAASAVRRDR